jgi:hypothetical protein
MERRQPETARTDLLSELKKSDFWEDVEIINRELAAYSSEEPGDIPPRNHPDTLALELSARYSNPQYLGETAAATIAHESPNGELSIEQITGELGLFTYTTITSEEYTGGVNIATDQRVAALQIGETAVPLSPETLLRLDIENPTPDEDPNDTFSYIISRVREINALRTKPSYQAASPSEQAVLEVNAVEDVNQHLDAITNDNTVSIVTLKYDDGTTRSSIRARDISVTMRGNYPHFQIIGTDNLVHSIPYDGVIDIKITDEPVDIDINVIDIFNDETIRNRIDYIESTTYCSEDDLAELTKDLEETIGDNFCQDGIFSGTGMLYRKESSGDIEGEFADFTLLSRGLDVLEIDGERKLVITLKDPNSPPDTSLYIIPDTTHLSQCIRRNAPRAMEFEPDCDLIECLRSAASAAEKLIKSDDFINADDIEEQRIMLEDQETIKNVLSDLRYSFEYLCQEYLIHCTAREYWSIDIDTYESDSYSPEEIAKSDSVKSEPDKSPLEITGEVVDFIIPEFEARKKKITSIADLPLSQGRPMLQIIDVSNSQRVYFVPIDNLLSIMPFTWTDETGG